MRQRLQRASFTSLSLSGLSLSGLTLTGLATVMAAGLCAATPARADGDPNAKAKGDGVRSLSRASNDVSVDYSVLDSLSRGASLGLLIPRSGLGALAEAPIVLQPPPGVAPKLTPPPGVANTPSRTAVIKLQPPAGMRAEAAPKPVPVQTAKVNEAAPKAVTPPAVITETLPPPQKAAPAAKAEAPKPAPPAVKAEAPKPVPPAPPAKVDVPKPPAPAAKVEAPKPATPAPAAKAEAPKPPPKPAVITPPPATAPTAKPVEPPKVAAAPVTPPPAPKTAAPTPAPAPAAPAAAAPGAPRPLTPQAAPETKIAAVPAAPAAKPAEPAKTEAPEAPAPQTAATETAPEESKVEEAQPAEMQTAALPPPDETPGTLTISFGVSVPEVPASAEADLRALAKRLSANPELRVQLLAFASDPDQSVSRSRRLSLERAVNVRKQLLAEGIDSTRIEVRALGEQSGDGAPDRVDAIINRR